MSCKPGEEPNSCLDLLLLTPKYAKYAFFTKSVIPCLCLETVKEPRYSKKRFDQACTFFVMTKL